MQNIQSSVSEKIKKAIACQPSLPASTIAATFEL